MGLLKGYRCNKLMEVVNKFFRKFVLQNPSMVTYDDAKAIPVSQLVEREKEKIDPLKDKRIRYEDTTDFPQSAIGIVLVELDDGRVFWRTGIMVGPDIFYTAAHNVYDDSKPVRKKYSNIKFISGINGDVTPFGKAKIRDIYTSEAYVSHHAEGEEEQCSEDYALLMLKELRGKKADYLGLHITSQKFLQDKEINSKKGTFKQ